MHLASLIVRTLTHVKDRALRSPDPGVVLGSETGLRREENQDRVAAFKILRPGHPMPMISGIILSDGMGGMQGGAECAALTVAEFIQSVADHRGKNIQMVAGDAAESANLAVFQRFAGRGGATLSAVLTTPETTVTVNVGDSRIYLTDSNPLASSARLSVDDTMAEAFGSSGQQLIQFIGLGEGLRPHTQEVRPLSGTLWLTSDGIHYPNGFFYEVLATAPDLRAAAERTLALARWLGSPDNASIVGIKKSETSWLSEENSQIKNHIVIEVNTAEDRHVFYGQMTQAANESPRKAREVLHPPRPKATVRKTKRRSPSSGVTGRKQFEIEIDLSEED